MTRWVLNGRMIEYLGITEMDTAKRKALGVDGKGTSRSRCFDVASQFGDAGFDSSNSGLDGCVVRMVSS